MTTMTIRLEQHTRQTPIHVEDLDEGYGVRLVVDLDANELVGGHRANEALELAETRLEVRKSGVHYLALEEPLSDDQRRENAHLEQADAELIVAELDRLRRALESVKNERSIWRELIPTEARAVAAALVHFAGEAEARR